MYSFAALAALVSVSISGVSAHGGVVSYSIAGTFYDGWKAYNSPTGQTTIQRPWNTYNPILDANDPTLACNDDGTSGPSQLTATVQAGQSILQNWNQIWPHDTGPVLTYLAKCPGSSCTGVNANTLKWFKIQEAGLLSGTIGNGKWAAGKMIDQDSSWTTTIPASVPSGHYLIRSETIALHSLPAQFYPECAQIEITGGGSREPTAAELVSFPGAYSNSDPGINVDLYGSAAQTQSTYIIPGPPLYGGSGSSNPPATTPPVGTTTPPATTSNPPATTSNPPATTPPAGTIAQYGQCGGQDWTGATGCVAPFTCTPLNDYYSQCL